VKIRVVLADDHSVVRDGIKAAIEWTDTDIRVVGEASNGREVLSMAQKSPADVYVLDISMPVLNGIETTGQLKQLVPDSKALILSMHDSLAFVEKALQAGADGYIVKQCPTEEILHAIREVHAGNAYLSPRAARYVIQGFLHKTEHSRKGKSFIQLTRKEKQILQLLAEGKTSKQAAHNLGISVNTVHVHANNIMQKLNIHNRADLVRFALREGVIQI